MSGISEPAPRDNIRRHRSLRSDGRRNLKLLWLSTVKHAQKMAINEN